MIPEPVPIAPLLVILAVTGLLLAFAAFKSSTGYFRSIGSAPSRQATAITAVVSGALTLAVAALFVTVSTTHQTTYSHNVWEALDSQYNVQPANEDQKFTAGKPFAAVSSGASASCTVILPSTISCDDVDVPPITKTPATP